MGKLSIQQAEYAGALSLIAVVPWMLPHLSLSSRPPGWLGRLQPMEVLFPVVAILWIIQTLREPGRLRRVPLKFPLFLYLLASVWSGINAGNLPLWLLDVAILSYLSMVYLIIASVIDSQRKLLRAWRVWMISAALIALVGLLGYGFAAATGKENFLVDTGDLPFLGKTIRLKSFLQPTASLLSAFLTLSLPVGFVLFAEFSRRRLKRILFGVVLAAMIIADLVTFTRGFVASLVAMGVVLLRYRRKSATWALSAYALLSIAILGLVGVFIASSIRIDSFPFRHSPDASEPAGPPAQFSPYYPADSIGIYLWLRRAALWMFKEHPFLGVGAGNYGLSIEQYIQEGVLPAGFAAVETAHGELFDRLAETGLLGLVTWGVFMLALGHMLVRGYVQSSFPASSLPYALMAGFLGIAAASIHLDVSHFRFLWIALGLGAASCKLARA